MTNIRCLLRRSLLRQTAGLLMAACCCVAAPAATLEPVVIGQSVPNGFGSYRATVALKQGARAMVGAINANGGINGRLLKLVSLDGGSNPATHAENVRQLVHEYKAVAIIGCAGDSVCQATAKAAAEMHVPLVGAMSGSASLTRESNPWLFTLRPSYELEASALARQLKSLGLTRAVLLTDSGLANEKAQTLKRAAEAQGIRCAVVEVLLSQPDSAERVAEQVGAVGAQALIVDLVPDSVDLFAPQETLLRQNWPKVVVSMASSSFQGLGNLLPDRVIGFTQVVPNPDADSMPLTVEFQRNTELYSNGAAINFDGMAAYMAVRLSAYAIHQSGSRVPSAEGVAAALAGLEKLDMGGYLVSFTPGRQSGSDWVRIGMRARNGTYLK